MNDPVKLIWKFKNNNKRTQYNIFIFIGDLVPSNINKILEKIKDLNLYDTWISLDKNEYDKMSNYYGDFWYKLFFNKYHIDSTMSIVKESKIQRTELIDKYGEDWFDKHIKIKEEIKTKIIYSFEALIKNELTKKENKKLRTMAITQNQDDEEKDFTLVKKKLSLEQRGGESDEYIGEINTDDNYDEALEYNIDEDVPEELEENIPETDLIDEDEIDLDEIADMYKETEIEPDKHVNETSKLIKKALNDEKIFSKLEKHIVNFDDTRNNNVYDENLKDVYNKTYVKTQFIFKDDTIKDIRNKICCGIKMDKDLYDGDLHLIPFRQYLWSEYFFNGEINKIMIGQKWLRRNELLNVDIEPLSNLRAYEELREPLKLLRDNIKRYNNKIRREDDDNNILYDYEEYISNNELYMIDLYHELGRGYKPNNETLRNLQDVYLRIYFPKVKSEDLRSILDFLNNKTEQETNKINIVYNTINNDLILTNEIMETVETVKMKDKYTYLFKENYITQSVINLNLRLLDNTKLNLFRIFNEFNVDDQFPFIQYQKQDGSIVYKFNEDKINKYLEEPDNKELIEKWFSTSIYGISFRMRIEDESGSKFMSVILKDNARLEYKTQWKEEDGATIQDISKTYKYIKDLINKINSTNRIKIDMPDDSEFKFAFINSIQKFELPGSYIIDHNDLSDFSRYFYPYISLVIAPRKRQAKIPKSEKSKFGTYLRYKRVSKYDNQSRIEQRIMYFIRNYEFTEKELIDEVSKQFNITEEKSLEEYQKVKQKYPNLKKSRKVLKKLENIPKYKPPGIGADIQGKTRDKYKIRISGARSQKQLERIITFLNILIFLYTETYLMKIDHRQELKKKLASLKNIAERRQKVDYIVNYAKDVNNVKQMAQLDKMRIGFKPEKGQNQWTRSCQNSGTDKKRRPQQYNSLNIAELFKRGYKLNKKTGDYEKVVTIREHGKKKEITLRTIKLDEIDNEGNTTGNEIHYACSPEENGEHFYIGFLTRSSNPFGHCMPCCFKKDPLDSKNKEKREFYMNCLKNVDVMKMKEVQKLGGDKLYILQDTNKIQEGRFGFLPRYLDIYFNYGLNLERTKEIKHHYLVKSETGYFFKYGSKQEPYPFVNAVCSIYDIEYDILKKKLISVLESDTNDLIFNALNNGDIKTIYGTRKEFIRLIKSNQIMTYELINHLLSLPNVISDKGIKIIIFRKRNIIIRKELEKEKIKEDFILTCQNDEDIESLNTSKDCIFMIQDDINYYPIVMVLKEEETSKTMDIVKIFHYENNAKNVVYNVNKLYEKNCIQTIKTLESNKNLTARLLEHYLYELNDKQFKVKSQIIDSKYKCKYLITNNGILLPVKPSGSLYNIPIENNINKYISDYETTYSNLMKIYKISSKKIPVKPIGVYYDDIADDNVVVNSIMTKNNGIIPVKTIKLSVSELTKKKLKYEKKTLYDILDIELSKPKPNYIIDDRIKTVKFDEYISENYQLFRLEFSEYINSKNNIKVRNYLDNLFKIESKIDRLRQIKLFVYKLIDNNLSDKYKHLFQLNEIKENTTYNKLVDIINEIPDVINFKLNNDRITCNKSNKSVCEKNPYCNFNSKGCYLTIPKKYVINFVNKISEELVQYNIKAYELLQIEGYYVSDIVDMNKYTEQPHTKIITGTSFGINKVLNDLFGKKTVGKRFNKEVDESLSIQLNTENPMIDRGEYYTQTIIDNNMSILRAYSNGYYWLLSQYNDEDTRNIGYYSNSQTQLSNQFRSMIIEWLINDDNHTNIFDKLLKYFEIHSNINDAINDFIIKLMHDIHMMSNGVIELHVLSIVNKIPIVVYDSYGDIRYVFDEGIIYDRLYDKNKNMDKYKNIKTCIHIIMNYFTSEIIPEKVEVLYIK